MIRKGAPPPIPPGLSRRTVTGAARDVTYAAGMNGLRRLTPVVKWSFIVFAAFFVVTAIGVRVSDTGAAIYTTLRLDPALVLRRPWTLLTYALLHDLSDPQHLLFNALGLYFFAPELEELWGSRKYLLFSVLTALGGGLLITAVALIGLGGNPVVGASSIVMGAVIAWGLIFRDREIRFFFVLPMKGIHMVYVSIGFELLNALSFSRVSAAGHFGGMIAGALFASIASGGIRKAWLRHKLGRLQATKDAMEIARSGGRYKPPLRVIRGGADRPKDKSWLN